jgi:hypothetical protein
MVSVFTFMLPTSTPPKFACFDLILSLPGTAVGVHSAVAVSVALELPVGDAEGVGLIDDDDDGVAEGVGLPEEEVGDPDGVGVPEEDVGLPDGVGVPEVDVAVGDGQTLTAASESFVTKALLACGPLKVEWLVTWNAPAVVGKSAEAAPPVT